MAKRKVEGSEIYDIVLVSEGLTYKEESGMVKKLKVTHYNLYALGEIAFTTHNRKFIENLESGELCEITFEETDAVEAGGTEKKPIEAVPARLEFRGCVTFDEMERLEARAEKQSARAFKKEMMQAKNFLANPALLTQVGDLEKVMGASA